MKNLMNITDLTVEEIDELIAVAEDIIANPVKYQDACRHKLLATLFFEPSTRTRLSFESAMHRLGGSVVGFSEAGSSSSAKGESLSDTVQTVGCYADIIAMRHPKEGAPMVAAMNATIPVINAGDGGHNHPTQTLADLLTIKLEKGQGEKGAMQEIEEQFGFPVYSVVDVYDIIEYLEEDPANEENVTRIKNYLAVNGAK